LTGDERQVAGADRHGEQCTDLDGEPVLLEMARPIEEDVHLEHAREHGAGKRKTACPGVLAARPGGGFVDGLPRRDRATAELEGPHDEMREVPLRGTPVEPRQLGPQTQRFSPLGEEPVERQPPLPRREILGA
jgi:hypothetical protein